MSETLKQVILDAIEKREKELAELQDKLRELESEDKLNARRTRRTRRQTGFKTGSIPAQIFDCLKDSGRPMAAAEIAERVGKSVGRKIESRFIAAAINRYIESKRFFEQNQEGLYTIRK